MDFCHRINWRNDVMEGMLACEHKSTPFKFLADNKGAREWMTNLPRLHASKRDKNHNDPCTLLFLTSKRQR